jgi:hypothetical protein
LPLLKRPSRPLHKIIALHNTRAMCDQSRQPALQTEPELTFPLSSKSLKYLFFKPRGEMASILLFTPQRRFAPSRGSEQRCPGPARRQR